MTVDENFRYVRGNIQSTLINSHATLVLVWPGHESWENSHANSRFSTLMQLLFSFDRDMRVEKTLTQTLASQLSSTLMQLLFSFDRGRRVEKTPMQTLASQLSCNSCSRLTGAGELRKLSCKLSLLNSHATLVLVWRGTRVEKTLASQLTFETNLASRVRSPWRLQKIKIYLINYTYIYIYIFYHFIKI
jgi:hypothetical protein